MDRKLKTKSGFALMMSLIVVSVVVSIGLTLLDVTTKQLRLSANSRDSEIAIHAATAGIECAHYWRNESTQMENGENASLSCFGGNVDPVSISPSAVTVSGSGNARLYEFQKNWGSGSSERCSVMKVLIINADDTGPATVNNLPTRLSGYPTVSKTCETNGKCAVLVSRGYSKGCSNITSPGTIEREILLEL